MATNKACEVFLFAMILGCFMPALAQIDKENLQGPVAVQKPSNRLQFNITRTKHAFPISPTTAALMALVQAIVLSAIVIVGLFCGPGMQPPKKPDIALHRRIKMERSV